MYGKSQYLKTRKMSDSS